jgi:hypothetical protein
MKSEFLAFGLLAITNEPIHVKFGMKMDHKHTSNLL